jgi:hypothetical protein
MSSALQSVKGYTNLEAMTRIGEEEKVQRSKLKDILERVHHFTFTEHLKYRFWDSPAPHLLRCRDGYMQFANDEERKTHQAHSLFEYDLYSDFVSEVVFLGSVGAGAIAGLMSQNLYVAVSIPIGFALASFAVQGVKFALLKLRDTKEEQQSQQELFTIDSLKIQIAPEKTDESVDFDQNHRIVKYLPDGDLKKLDFHQMLSLFKHDREMFWTVYNANLLNEEKALIITLNLLSQMDPSELLEAFTKDEIKTLFKDYPFVVQGLVDLLPTGHLSDVSLQEKLMDVTETLRIPEEEKEILKQTIRKDEKQLASDKIITFIVGKEKIKVSRKLLSKHSSVIRGMLEELNDEKDEADIHLIGNPRAFKMIVEVIGGKKALNITLENWLYLWNEANHWDFTEVKKAIVSWLRLYLTEIIKNMTIGTLIEYCFSKDLPEILSLLDTEYRRRLELRADLVGDAPEFLEIYQNAVSHDLTSTLTLLSDRYWKNLVEILQNAKPQDAVERRNLANQLVLFLTNFEVVLKENKTDSTEKVLNFILEVAQNEKGEENPKFIKILYDCAQSGDSQAFKDLLSQFLQNPENQNVCKAAWAVVPKMV